MAVESQDVRLANNERCERLVDVRKSVGQPTHADTDQALHHKLQSRVHHHGRRSGLVLVLKDSTCHQLCACGSGRQSHIHGQATLVI